ncbi:DUF5753 domain-containing protein [Actinomadura welshii]|uniref:DUF5753 domain-containing protein n=1 Tax=Actinomadura welshii TaxID=3103817 RepID=UPI000428FF27|nr:DUF5753 domain-containing protein [Actinomadura madurae]
MTDIMPRGSVAPPASMGLRPLSPNLDPEVQAWVEELRGLWGQVGMSQGRFARTYHFDKSVVSRYLNGHRVPGDQSFLERLLAIKAERGMEVSPEVRTHLAKLWLEALRVRHPHEYRVRIVRDELHAAVVGQREADRYAAHLEEQLAERIRRHGRLKAAWDRDRAALQAERDQLEAEITDLTSQLGHARRRATEGEQRCQELEELLYRLETFQSRSDGIPSMESRNYAELEESASLIRTYGLHFVPALLQTEGYASEIIRLSSTGFTDQEIDQRVRLRMNRQEILTGPGAPFLWAAIDEGALRRPIGDPEVMRGQFKHLIEMSRLPKVTIQIMPFGYQGRVSEGGAFTILRFSERNLPDMVYVENLTSTMYLDDPEEVDVYMRSFNTLCIDSMEAKYTVELLDEFLRLTEQTDAHL